MAGLAVYGGRIQRAMYVLDIMMTNGLWACYYPQVIKHLLFYMCVYMPVCTTENLD